MFRKTRENAFFMIVKTGCLVSSWFSSLGGSFDRNFGGFRSFSFDFVVDGSLDGVRLVFFVFVVVANVLRNTNRHSLTSFVVVIIGRRPHGRLILATMSFSNVVVTKAMLLYIATVLIVFVNNRFIEYVQHCDDVNRTNNNEKRSCCRCFLDICSCSLMLPSHTIANRGPISFLVL